MPDPDRNDPSMINPDPPGRSPGLPATRHDWTVDEVVILHDRPFCDLLFEAQTVHRRVFVPNVVQMSTLLSVKTGACPEDCAYCPQSAHHAPGTNAEPLLTPEAVLERAREARACGSTRFCMGAAWRSPRDRDLDVVVRMIEAVKSLGMETCATLGMLTEAQAHRLADAGLDFYNHNLDTSPEHYGKVISTRTYEDRRRTLTRVRQAGIHVCCGGIVGMGESVRDRAGLLVELANMPVHPESVPINLLVQVPGTPLHGTAPVDPLDFVRVVALARILMPRSRVRLSAGRDAMSDETQALCFLAGANSIFYGERLLTTPNPNTDRDGDLMRRLGLVGESRDPPDGSGAPATHAPRSTTSRSA